MAQFHYADRDQIYLLPPSIQDWLPPNHLAHFIVDVVDEIGLDSITSQYNNWGKRAYSPEILVPLLLYGYATGVYSSRQIERSTYDSIAFRYIAGNLHPDHDTIAHFRRRFHEEIKALFVEVLEVAVQMKFTNLGKISLDGTKIKANASKHKALSSTYANGLQEELKAQIAELLRLAEEADLSGLPDEFSIADELKRREDRLVEIEKAIAEMNSRAQERHASEMEEYEKKLEAREKKERETGKKLGGRGPKPPVYSGPKTTDQVNLTDPESRIMPKGKDFVQAYNAQAGVDTDSMLIVGHRVTQNPNDKKELIPMLEQLESLPDEFGKVGTVIADSGYFSENNVKACVNAEVVPLIAHSRERRNKSALAHFSEPTECAPCELLDPVGHMKHKLQTREGKKDYSLRKSTVEPVFGIIKSIMKFERFSMRGIKLVESEWALASTAWNLKRMHSLQQQRLQITAQFESLLAWIMQSVDRLPLLRELNAMLQNEAM